MVFLQFFTILDFITLPSHYLFFHDFLFSYFLFSFHSTILQKENIYCFENDIYLSNSNVLVRV